MAGISVIVSVMGGWELDDFTRSSSFVILGISLLRESSVSMIGIFLLFKNYLRIFLSFFFLTPLPKANEKKVDQPPEAKKPKIKVVNVELPVEANLVWQLGKDLLNMYIETEVIT